MRLFFQGGNLKRVKREMPKVRAVERGWGVTARSKYMGVCVCALRASVPFSSAAPTCALL